MDDESIDDQFMSMALNEYRDSIHKFIDDTRIAEMQVRVLIDNGQHEEAAVVSTRLFNAVSTIQLGNMHNLITSYAHVLNEERLAGLYVYDLANEVLAGIRAFHQHLVTIGQPDTELLMITDLMAKLSDGLDNSSYTEFLNRDG